MLCFGREIPEMIKAHWFSEMLTIAHTMTECHMAENLNTQQHRSMNRKSCICNLASFKVLTVLLLALQLLMLVILTVCYMQQNPKCCCYLSPALWHLFKAFSLSRCNTVKVNSWFPVFQDSLSTRSAGPSKMQSNYRQTHSVHCILYSGNMSVISRALIQNL
jgi:hypothetical protein